MLLVHLARLCNDCASAEQAQLAADALISQVRAAGASLSRASQAFRARPFKTTPDAHRVSCTNLHASVAGLYQQPVKFLQ